jgi:DnaJ-domain-containing protein 1
MAASAYLGRIAASKPAGPSAVRPASMSLAEARMILGVAADADKAQIQAAYRRLMLRAHPDQGGSAGLAVQLNAARDCLLNKK